MNNTPNTTITIDTNVIPEGYEAVRFGLPKEGEAYLHSRGEDVLVSTVDYGDHPRLILRKKETRRYLEFTWEVGSDPVCTDRKINLYKDDVSALSTCYLGDLDSDLDPPNYYNVFLVWDEDSHPLKELEKVADQIPNAMYGFIVQHIMSNINNLI